MKTNELTGSQLDCWYCRRQCPPEQQGNCPSCGLPIDPEEIRALADEILADNEVDNETGSAA